MKRKRFIKKAAKLLASSTVITAALLGIQMSVNADGIGSSGNPGISPGQAGGSQILSFDLRGNKPFHTTWGGIFRNGESGNGNDMDRGRSVDLIKSSPRVTHVPNQSDYMYLQLKNNENGYANLYIQPTNRQDFMPGALIQFALRTVRSYGYPASLRYTEAYAANKPLENVLVGNTKKWVEGARADGNGKIIDVIWSHWQWIDHKTSNTRTVISDVWDGDTQLFNDSASMETMYNKNLQSYDLKTDTGNSQDFSRRYRLWAHNVTKIDVRTTSTTDAGWEWQSKYSTQWSQDWHAEDMTATYQAKDPNLDTTVYKPLSTNTAGVASATDLTNHKITGVSNTSLNGSITNIKSSYNGNYQAINNNSDSHFTVNWNGNPYGLPFNLTQTQNWNQTSVTGTFNGKDITNSVSNQTYSNWSAFGRYDVNGIKINNTASPTDYKFDSTVKDFKINSPTAGNSQLSSNNGTDKYAALNYDTNKSYNYGVTFTVHYLLWGKRNIEYTGNQKHVKSIRGHVKQPLIVSDLKTASIKTDNINNNVPKSTVVNNKKDKIVKATNAINNGTASSIFDDSKQSADWLYNSGKDSYVWNTNTGNLENYSANVSLTKQNVNKNITTRWNIVTTGTIDHITQDGQTKDFDKTKTTETTHVPTTTYSINSTTNSNKSNTYKSIPSSVPTTLYRPFSFNQGGLAVSGDLSYAGIKNISESSTPLTGSVSRLVSTYNSNYQIINNGSDSKFTTNFNSNYGLPASEDMSITSDVYLGQEHTGTFNGQSINNTVSKPYYQNVSAWGKSENAQTKLNVQATPGQTKVQNDGKNQTWTLSTTSSNRSRVWGPNTSAIAVSYDKKKMYYYGVNFSQTFDANNGISDSKVTSNMKNHNVTNKHVDQPLVIGVLYPSILNKDTINQSTPHQTVSSNTKNQISKITESINGANKANIYDDSSKSMQDLYNNGTYHYLWNTNTGNSQNYSSTQTMYSQPVTKTDTTKWNVNRNGTVDHIKDGFTGVTKDYDYTKTSETPHVLTTNYSGGTITNKSKTNTYKTLAPTVDTTLYRPFSFNQGGLAKNSDLSYAAISGISEQSTPLTGSVSKLVSTYNSNYEILNNGSDSKFTTNFNSNYGLPASEVLSRHGSEYLGQTKTGTFNGKDVSNTISKPYYNNINASGTTENTATKLNGKSKPDYVPVNSDGTNQTWTLSTTSSSPSRVRGTNYYPAISVAYDKNQMWYYGVNYHQWFDTGNGITNTDITGNQTNNTSVAKKHVDQPLVVGVLNPSKIVTDTINQSTPNQTVSSNTKNQISKITESINGANKANIYDDSSKSMQDLYNNGTYHYLWNTNTGNLQNYSSTQTMYNQPVTKTDTTKWNVNKTGKVDHITDFYTNKETDYDYTKTSETPHVLSTTYSGGTISTKSKTNTYNASAPTVDTTLYRPFSFNTGSLATNGDFSYAAISGINEQSTPLTGSVSKLVSTYNPNYQIINNGSDSKFTTNFNSNYGLPASEVLSRHGSEYLGQTKTGIFNGKDVSNTISKPYYNNINASGTTENTATKLNGKSKPDYVPINSDGKDQTWTLSTTSSSRSRVRGTNYYPAMSVAYDKNQMWHYGVNYHQWFDTGNGITNTDITGNQTNNTSVAKKHVDQPLVVGVLYPSILTVKDASNTVPHSTAQTSTVNKMIKATSVVNNGSTNTIFDDTKQNNDWLFNSGKTNYTWNSDTGNNKTYNGVTTLYRQPFTKTITTNWNVVTKGTVDHIVDGQTNVGKDYDHSKTTETSHVPTTTYSSGVVNTTVDNDNYKAKDPQIDTTLYRPFTFSTGSLANNGQLQASGIKNITETNTPLQGSVSKLVSSYNNNYDIINNGTNSTFTSTLGNNYGLPTNQDNLSVNSGTDGGQTSTGTFNGQNVNNGVSKYWYSNIRANANAQNANTKVNGVAGTGSTSFSGNQNWTLSTTQNAKSLLMSGSNPGATLYYSKYKSISYGVKFAKVLDVNAGIGKSNITGNLYNHNDQHKDVVQPIIIGQIFPALITTDTVNKTNTTSQSTISNDTKNKLIRATYSENGNNPKELFDDSLQNPQWKYDKGRDTYDYSGNTGTSKNYTGQLAVAVQAINKATTTKIDTTVTTTGTIDHITDQNTNVKKDYDKTHSVTDVKTGYAYAYSATSPFTRVKDNNYNVVSPTVTTTLFKPLSLNSGTLANSSQLAEAGLSNIKDDATGIVGKIGLTNPKEPFASLDDNSKTLFNFQLGPNYGLPSYIKFSDNGSNPPSWLTWSKGTTGNFNGQNVTNDSSSNYYLTPQPNIGMDTNTASINDVPGPGVVNIPNDGLMHEYYIRSIKSGKHYLASGSNKFASVNYTTAKQIKYGVNFNIPIAAGGSIGNPKLGTNLNNVSSTFANTIQPLLVGSVNTGSVAGDGSGR